MEYLKISIITPNYNLGEYLEKTIQSVVNQNYPNLEYIVIDGGSSDNSQDIIKKYEEKLFCWISEPDNGMYDALNKGFSKCSGSIMGWINSDDVLQPNSLFVLNELFQKYPKISWIQGKPTIIDESDNLVKYRSHYSSKYSFLLKDYYSWYGDFIQQESTFWTRKLWSKTGGYISTDYSLAGDFELWMRFFKEADLYNTNRLLGAFRKRKGQKTETTNDYIQEADSIVDNYLKTLSIHENFNLLIIRIFRSKIRFLGRGLKFFNHSLIKNKMLD